MKLFSANIESLRALYINHLQKALDMEQKITKALPTMIEKATDAELADAFSTHLNETEGHVTKVEGLLRQISGEASAGTCKAISGIITEAQDGIKDAAAPAVLDVVLIAGAQEVEHHEIAVYGTLRNWAEILGLDDHADVLEAILDEEKNTDEILTELAETLNTTAESNSTSAESVSTAGRTLA